MHFKRDYQEDGFNKASQVSFDNTVILFKWETKVSAEMTKVGN